MRVRGLRSFAGLMQRLVREGEKDANTRATKRATAHLRRQVAQLRQRERGESRQLASLQDRGPRIFAGLVQGLADGAWRQISAPARRSARTSASGRRGSEPGSSGSGSSSGGCRNSGDSGGGASGSGSSSLRSSSQSAEQTGRQRNSDDARNVTAGRATGAQSGTVSMRQTCDVCGDALVYYRGARGGEPALSQRAQTTRPLCRSREGLLVHTHGADHPRVQSRPAEERCR